MRIVLPTHLTDSQLIDGLKRFARRERCATAVLVAHLAEMDARRLHLGAGFSSLFAYCREVLRLSESAAYKRIEVARAARKWPLVLDRLGRGLLSLATARLLAPHLTAENHRDLLAAAAGLGKRAVEELVARRFPRADVAPLVRRLPAPKATVEPSAVVPGPIVSAASLTPLQDVPPPVPRGASPTPPGAMPIAVRTETMPIAVRLGPVVTPLAADRYQIRFTASAATRDKLRIAQDLLRHAVPNGDPAEIVDRALTALIASLAKKKCATVALPARLARPTAAGSRHVPAIVRRAVWARDEARCAFLTTAGWRCREHGFLEFHHVRPFAVGGGATVANIQLRCRAHNGHEATVFYGREATGPGASRVKGTNARGFSDSA